MHRSQRSTIRPFVGFALLVAVLLSGSAIAAEIGTVAGVDGSAYIYTGGKGTPAAAAIGSPVNLGDQLATGRPGRMKVVFQDDSVLTVSDDSRVTVDEHVFDPSQGKARSLFGLLRGKVNAAVSEYYGRPGSGYEIKTETAVAGVRGTEFAMAYDPETHATEVTGITGVVKVHSMRDPEGPGILITANESTTIQANQLPSMPQRMNERLFRDRIEGFDFVGRGRPESLINTRSLSQGNTVARVGGGQNVVTPNAAPGTESSVTRNAGTDGDATGKVGQPPAAVLRTGQLGIAF